MIKNKNIQQANELAHPEAPDRYPSQVCWEAQNTLSTTFSKFRLTGMESKNARYLRHKKANVDST